jgi:hypothetical protein
MRASPIGSEPAACRATAVRPHIATLALAATADRRTDQVSRQPAATSAPLECGEHVVLDRKPAVRLDALESAAQPATGSARRRPPRDLAAVELDPSGVRHADARDDIEQCRLASAVRADEPAHVAGVDGEVHVGEGGDAPEVHAHVFERQDDAVSRGVAGVRALDRRHSVSARSPMRMCVLRCTES